MAETAQLFITCLVDTLYPDVGQAVVRVLRRCGVGVDLPPGQTCCGQPAFNAGMRNEARGIAIHTIRTFEKTEGPVVVPSGSCAAMIRHGYLELFAEDPQWLPRANALAVRTYELTEFLVDRLGVDDVGAQFDGQLAYHSSCHLLRDLGVNHQPRTLLASVQGAELVELQGSEECCGFGGVFSAEHPQLSSAMLKRKIENIRACGAPLVVTCDAGCMSNINGGLHRYGMIQRAVHIAQILDNR